MSGNRPLRCSAQKSHPVSTSGSWHPLRSRKCSIEPCNSWKAAAVEGKPKGRVEGRVSRMRAIQTSAGLHATPAVPTLTLPMY